jgi:predicted nucleic acid-binding protein
VALIDRDGYVALVPQRPILTTAIVAVDMSADHGLAPADAMINATARLKRCELVTADADFRGLPGVTLREIAAE